MTQGICRNAACPNGASGTPIERYPGPGEYCSECGEPLEAVPEPERPEARAKPFGGLTALEALQQLEPPQVQAAPRPRKRGKPLVFVSAALTVAVIGGALVAFHPAAVGHPSGDALHVCRSSISERLADDVVAAYRAKTGEGAPQIAFTRDDACDVRFAVVAGGDAAGSTVVGRDAVVVVVNPLNPLVQLTPNQVRQILTGEVTDWSQVGRGSGPITAVVPDESTDEASVLQKQILAGAKLARGVQPVASTAEVVALVSGPHGRNAIGVAAFSGAVPAKVVRLGASPPASALSIADGRYPLVLTVTVEAAGATPPAAATSLVRYARSDDVQEIAARDGLVSLKGY
jgi:hypothetical protein